MEGLGKTLIDEHKELKWNGKKVYKLKKQFVQCASTIKKSRENVNRNYKISQKNWLDSSKKLERAEKNAKSNDNLYEVYSKYETLRREAETTKDIYIINETNMYKEEEHYKNSMHDLLTHIKRKSQEIYEKCTDSLRNLKSTAEYISFKCQKLPHLFDPHEKLQSVDLEGLTKSSPKVHIHRQKNLQVLYDSEMKEKPLINNEEENIGKEESLKVNSYDMLAKKLFCSGHSRSIERDDELVENDSQEKSLNLEIGFRPCNRSRESLEYLYRDITEGLVRFNTYAASSRNSYLGRSIVKMEKHSKSRCVNPVKCTDLSDSVSREELSRKNVLDLSVKSRLSYIE